MIRQSRQTLLDQATSRYPSFEVEHPEQWRGAVSEMLSPLLQELSAKTTQPLRQKPQVRILRFRPEVRKVGWAQKPIHAEQQNGTTEEMYTTTTKTVVQHGKRQVSTTSKLLFGDRL